MGREKYIQSALFNNNNIKMAKVFEAILLTAFLASTHGLDYDDYELTCGNGEVIDLEPEEYLYDAFHWYSPRFLDGEEYPANTECKVTFRLPPKQNWQITSVEDFDVNGDYSKGCEGGDYVQFTVNGKKSKKLCGEGWNLSDGWCWEDYCWPYMFEVVGNPDEDLIIEAVFKTGPNSTGARFDIQSIVMEPWEGEEPEEN